MYSWMLVSKSGFAYFEINWFSLTQQLSNASSSLARSETLCLPLLCMMEFCESWWGPDDVHAVSNAVNLYLLLLFYAQKTLFPCHPLPPLFPLSFTVIPKTLKEKEWDRFPVYGWSCCSVLLSTLVLVVNVFVNHHSFQIEVPLMSFAPMAITIILRT